jgi:hypothetical protein
MVRRQAHPPAHLYQRRESMLVMGVTLQHVRVIALPTVPPPRWRLGADT